MDEQNLWKNSTLIEHFLTSRCGKFIGEYLYLDLTGRIVEESLKKRIVDNDLPCICTFLKTNKKVIYLSMSYNNITSDGFSYLAHYLAEDDQLKSLNLMHNEIHSINEGVMRKTAPLWNLKCLILTGNKFEMSHGATLGKLLRCNTSITHLDIGETDQTVQSVSYVLDTLLPHLDGTQTLRKLNISRIIPYSFCKKNNSFYFCRLFSQVLHHNKTLVEVHLAKNSITDPDLEIMLEGLKHNKILEVLDLTANRLTSHGMELLSSILPETSLRYLLVGSNQIGSDGAISLGRIFGRTSLRFLDVSYNKIEDHGLRNLVWGMKAKIPPVHTFFFYGNPITSETAYVIQKQVFNGHISPFAMDVMFLWKADKLLLVEDTTANKYRNIHYFVFEKSEDKRPVHHSCCYQCIGDPSPKKSSDALHVPFRKISETVRDILLKK